jgi:hypothetical protein
MKRRNATCSRFTLILDLSRTATTPQPIRIAAAERLTAIE